MEIIAFSCYEKAIELNSKDPNTASNKRFTLFSLEDFEAILGNDIAIEIDPEHTEFLHNKGVAFYKLGETNEAIICFLARDLDKKFLSVYNYKG